MTLVDLIGAATKMDASPVCTDSQQCLFISCQEHRTLKDIADVAG